MGWEILGLGYKANKTSGTATKKAKEMNEEHPGVYKLTIRERTRACTGLRAASHPHQAVTEVARKRASAS